MVAGPVRLAQVNVYVKVSVDTFQSTVAYPNPFELEAPSLAAVRVATETKSARAGVAITAAKLAQIKTRLQIDFIDVLLK